LAQPPLFRYQDLVATDDLTAFDRFAQSWRAMALVALIALASALFGAGGVPVMDRDEARFVQATRQMLETGDYVHINVQAVERNKKPVGIHWLQAASVWFFKPLAGPFNTIWPYRFVSALGAMLAAVATLWAGRALIGPRAALIGASLFACGMLLGFEGMTAKTDAALLACVTVMMGALAHLRLGGAHAKRLTLIFWGALGLGVLVKGPIAPMVAVLTLATLAVWERRANWMKPLAWWPGPLLALLVVAPWVAAISIATHGRFFGGMGADIGPKLAGGSEGHFAWPGYHLALLPLLIFPASYALPFALRIGKRALQAKRDDAAFAALRLLLAWAVPTFLVFELAPTKLPHYTLPTYPALALICGAGVVMALNERWRITHALGLAVFALAGAGMVAAWSVGAAFASSESAATASALPAALAGALVLMGAVSVLGLARSLPVRLAAGVVCALVLSFGFRQIILPGAHGLFPSSEAAQALRANGLAARPLWVLGYRETSLVFLTRTDAHLTYAEDVAAHAAAGDAVVVSQDKLPALQELLRPRGLLFAQGGNAGEVHGLNLGNGRKVTLYVGVLAPN
jgi:4-amino-4-deoxy-L-arabinose transferase-like glycosyltransferase